MKYGPLCLAIAAALSVLRAAPQAAQPGDYKLLTESTREEIVAELPELSAMQFDSNQDRLDPILASAGDNLDAMFSKLPNLAATEQIHEMRFQDGAHTARQETFGYRLQVHGDASPPSFEELRLDAATGDPAPAPNGDFLVIGNFERLLRYLLPQYRADSHFRFLGRSGDSWIVAFAQVSTGGRLQSHFAGPDGRPAYLQGFVWIDAATSRIVRLRAGLEKHLENFPLDTVTTDISFAAVNFPSLDAPLWLPARVTVHARYPAGDLHSVHRFSDYRLSANDEKGAPDAPVNAAEDPWEMLAQSTALTEGSQPSQAIPLLRRALEIDPRMPAAHFQLAVALRSAGDDTGAETELREALRQSPNFGMAHNLLGVVLFARGDAAAAAIELRESTRLRPGDATAHFNLARVLEKTDPSVAPQEYRMAAKLAPGNAVIKSHSEQFERSAPAPKPPQPPDTTIKVEVRQVLVPVVVTDSSRHHVTGLKQSDFQVFEDGVEQKVTGFSVENLGANGPPVPATSNPREPAAPARPVSVRRTYLICIDTLHTDFADLAPVRAALSKLFRTEPAGDAEYIVVTLGPDAHVVQPPTSDPAAVLKTIESHDFQKALASTRKNAAEQDLHAFRHALQEARRACDEGSSLCGALKNALPPYANQLAAQERMSTAAFFGQLRSLVQSLSRAGGRRTVLLLSGGFNVIPGKQAYDLLSAFFSNGQDSGRVDRMTDLEPILQMAANHNIPIYTVDLRGLSSHPYFDGTNQGAPASVSPAVLGTMGRSASELGDTLHQMATATGGTAFQNRNDILGGMQQAFADGRQYYVLAYVSTNDKLDGKFRAISVRLRDEKLLVKSKPGYWAVPNNGA